MDLKLLLIPPDSAGGSPFPSRHLPDTRPHRRFGAARRQVPRAGGYLEGTAKEMTMAKKRPLKDLTDAELAAKVLRLAQAVIYQSAQILAVLPGEEAGAARETFRRSGDLARFWERLTSEALREGVTLPREGLLLAHRGLATARTGGDDLLGFYHRNNPQTPVN
jgi:hypothetical protein